MTAQLPCEEVGSSGLNFDPDLDPDTSAAAARKSHRSP